MRHQYIAGCTKRDTALVSGLERRASNMWQVRQPGFGSAWCYLMSRDRHDNIEWHHGGKEGTIINVYRTDATISSGVRIHVGVR